MASHTIHPSSPAPCPAVELRAVHKAFGGLQVLQGLNLRIPAGGVFGLIGPNGAGKTTVFNLISGLLAPSSGEILLFGQRADGRPPHEIARMGVGRTFQNIRLFGEMTLLENVLIGMHHRTSCSPLQLLLRGRAFRTAEANARTRAMELLSWVGLDAKADVEARQLSYGEQRKLELARALGTDPKVLVLDEPVAGMNSGEKAELVDEIESIAARGFTIVLIEHDMRFVMRLCREIAVLNFGRIICQGTPDEVRADPAVIEAYLGRDESTPLAGAME